MKISDNNVKNCLLYNRLYMILFSFSGVLSIHYCQFDTHCHTLITFSWRRITLAALFRGHRRVGFELLSTKGPLRLMRITWRGTQNRGRVRSGRDCDWQKRSGEAKQKQSQRETKRGRCLAPLLDSNVNPLMLEYT